MFVCVFVVVCVFVCVCVCVGESSSDILLPKSGICDTYNSEKLLSRSTQLSVFLPSNYLPNIYLHSVDLLTHNNSTHPIKVS